MKSALLWSAAVAIFGGLLAYWIPVKQDDTLGVILFATTTTFFSVRYFQLDEENVSFKAMNYFALGRVDWPEFVYSTLFLLGAEVKRAREEMVKLRVQGLEGFHPSEKLVNSMNDSAVLWQNTLSILNGQIDRTEKNLDEAYQNAEQLKKLHPGITLRDKGYYIENQRLFQPAA
jgi:hypothetical protein